MRGETSKPTDEHTQEIGHSVDLSSRTQQLRSAMSDLQRATGRSFVDLVVVLEAKAWRRGWLIGVGTGVALSFLTYCVWLWWME